MDIRSRTSFSSIEHSRNHERVQEVPAYGSDQALPCLWHEGLYGRSAPLESVMRAVVYKPRFQKHNLGRGSGIEAHSIARGSIACGAAQSEGVVGDVEMQCLMTATACGGVDRALTLRGVGLALGQRMMRSHRGRLSSLHERVRQVKQRAGEGCSSRSSARECHWHAYGRS